MKRALVIPAIATIGLLLGAAGAAVAAVGSHPGELSALTHAKTSMEQALTIARKTTGGKAVRIAFDHDHGRYIYRVKMLTKSGMERVAIDATSGRVLTVVGQS